MKAVLMASLAWAAAQLLLIPISAGANEPDPDGPTTEAGDDSLFVTWQDVTPEEIEKQAITPSHAQNSTQGQSISSEASQAPAQCWDGPLPENQDAFAVPAGLSIHVPACGDPEEPRDAAAGPARITPGRVLQAFRRIPLPAATLDIQPPGGKTLVNLDTIFSTTTADLDRTITLLGRRVQLRITPARYIWHHGDGTTQTSDWPGRPWEEDLDMSVYLTHAYEDAHVTVRPSVDVTYAADYRVGNGPWQPVNGTVTIQGPPSPLRIVEARPVLTGAGRP